ncbi:cationic amino acid transporter 2-like isoform X2 [Nilaparvata lugens]|nr:cationic amino acid transporter 2-like isoform X2 [Nilaparvata lugens]XP_039296820.1 cationic amino acid transporter 2-like isoform X2 [Nilaparvata lugens]
MWTTLSRKKPLVSSYVEASDLCRVLGLVDLTALGVASTLGMGVYIMAGSVAKIAGPGVAFSFLIAGFAATLSALCYGEFAARVPKAGSAYVYSYVTMGEFVAFIVGWNLCLEYVIGTACVARGLSNYIDALVGDTISTFFSTYFPMNIPFLASYPDFFGFFIMFSFSCVVAGGVEISSTFNKLFTFINLTTLVIVIVAGAYKANFSNWTLSPTDEGFPTDGSGGRGGFLPFGFLGVFSGAAKCFYSYTGFDSVATTGEEAKNPQKLIPLALLMTLTIAVVTYLGVAISLTLMWPYFDQSVRAPFPYAFEKTNMPGVKWVVTTGALCALCSCMVGCIYATSRIIYSMANDGLLFKPLRRVNSKTQTPLTATLLIGAFTGMVATIFDMEQLVDMTSIGTLTAYTIVSFCILLLRYEVQGVTEEKGLTQTADTLAEGSTLLRAFFNMDKAATPTSQSSLIVKLMVAFFTLSSVAFSASVAGVSNATTRPFAVFLMVLSSAGIIASVLVIIRQPQSREQLSFRVPLVPILPIVSSFMNIFLMVMLNVQTWVRFFIWMLLGFVIYFGYGIRHSAEAKKREQSPPAYNMSNPPARFSVTVD